MLLTTIFSILLLAPVILTTAIHQTGRVESFASTTAVDGDTAVATASVDGNTASASASSNLVSGLTSSLSAFSDVRVSSLPIIPIHYGSVQSVPVKQNVQTIQHVPVVEESVQTIQHVPVVQNYQTIQYLPLVHQQLPFFVSGDGNGNGFDGGIQSFNFKSGAIRGIGAGTGSGFGRYRESYSFKARNFGRGLNGFHHHGLGGGRIKAHYIAGGVDTGAGGFVGIKAGVLGGDAAGLLN